MARLVLPFFFLFSPLTLAQTLTPEALAVLEEAYDPSYTVVERTPIEENSRCSVRDLKIRTGDPVDLNETREILVREYIPKRDIDATIIIHPPNGGTNALDRRYASAFCKSGMQAFIMTMYSGMNETAIDWDVNNRFLLRGITAIKHVSQLAEAAIGVFGTSLGALVSAPALSFMPEVEAAVLLVGGAPFSQIVVESTNERLQRLKQERFREYDISDDEEYFRRVEENLVFKYTSAPLKAEIPIWQVISTQDDVVPTETQKNFAELFNPFKINRFSLSHLFTVIRFGARTGKTVNFFRDHLVE